MPNNAYPAYQTAARRESQSGTMFNPQSGAPSYMYGPAGPRQGTAQGYGMTESQLEQADTLRENSSEAVAETRQEVNVETARELEEEGDLAPVSSLDHTEVCTGEGNARTCRTVQGRYTPTDEEAPHGYHCSSSNDGKRTCTILTEPITLYPAAAAAAIQSTQVCHGEGETRQCQTVSGDYTPTNAEAPYGSSCVTVGNRRECAIHDKPALPAGMDKFVSATGAHGWWLIVAGVLAILIGALLMYFAVKAWEEYKNLPDNAKTPLAETTGSDTTTPNVSTRWLTTAAIAGIVAAGLSLFNPISSTLSFGILWVFAIVVIVVTAIALSALSKYKKGDVNKECAKVANTSANMTFALGLVSYILFTGVPLIVLGSMLVSWSSKAEQKLKEEGGNEANSTAAVDNDNGQ